MPRPSCRIQILEAAESVVADAGAAHLTLDAVAERAGVSKGGLLYHFPTKEALLEAMIGHLIDRYEERLAAELANPPPDCQSVLETEIVAGLEKKSSDHRVGSALLAAAANDPNLMTPVRRFYAQRYGRFAGESAADLEKTALLLAVDGLGLIELLQLSPFSAAQRRRVVAWLRDAARRLDTPA